MTIENAIKRNVTKNLNERERETRIENVREREMSI